MPPMTTVASGRWTSAPAPVAMAIGTKPRLATSAVISTGRKPSERTFDDRIADGLAFFAELVEVTNHHQAVENGHAAERDETNGGRDAERHPAKPEREDAAGDGERDAGIDHQRLPQTAEGEKDEHEDERQRRGHDDGKARAGFLQVFKLPAELDDIILGEMHLLLDAPLGFADEAFHVAHFKIHHEGGAALAVIAPDRLDCIQRLELHQLSERERDRSRRRAPAAS